MKVNKQKLQQIISEELKNVLDEMGLDSMLAKDSVQVQEEENQLSPKQKKLAMAHDNPPPGQQGDEKIDAKDLAALRKSKKD